jgi:hypothetical protein
MRATWYWAAPAVLFALAAGCGQNAEPVKNAPAAPSAESTPALASAELVTLHVEGMV